MGHNFFLSDGVEVRNKFIHNLAVSTMPAFSLLNTDQTPASFWITNPNNEFVGNHAAGAEEYGFWFDLPAHPTGASSSSHICPVGVKLGTFVHNVAHSNGRYGLRIFSEHTPRTYPCGETHIVPTLDVGLAEDEAFSQNPPIQAVYSDFLSYKNERAGVIADKIGAVGFERITTADNIQAGIEITLPGYAKLGQSYLKDALIVGMSENYGHAENFTQTKGVVTGQRDSFYYEKVHFQDFNKASDLKTSLAAIGTCSHCTVSFDSDGLANTHVFNQISFNNVTYRIKYTSTYRSTILYSVDGSLVPETSGERYLTGSKLHLYGLDKKCTLDLSLDHSAICTKAIRKLLFTQVKPKEIL